MDTIGSLISKLNDIMQSQEFLNRLNKVHDHSGFHDIVAEFVSPILPSSLVISTWSIRIEEWRYFDIAKYSRDFEAYKNSPRGDKGKFSNVRFSINDLLSESMNIKQARSVLRRHEIIERIIATEQAIHDYEKKIIECKQCISEFKEELYELDK